ncbi:unnamed protein product [Allacma fusca]|uniref:Alpha-and gamma-adaptin-binding protein p34 n=1 Tax=Allacma fusca TaxID=39272 RepID=A0A8J2PLN7_9HEXA|nr:unnamed protein product [Allacma fusca]
MEPCAVIASTCDSIFPDQIIKGILNKDTLPEPLELIEGVRSFPWHIVTKYYEADIHLCALDKKTIGSQEFADSVNAVIICFDCKVDSKLKPVEQWLSFTKEFEAEVKILICDQCHSESSSSLLASSIPQGVSRVEVQQWCVKNGFELVELNPEQSDLDSDVEDDFPESVGMERVIQALQAHLWPNLSLKDSRSMLPPNPGLQGLMNGLSEKDSSLTTNASDSNRDLEDTELKGKQKEVKVAKVKPMPKLIPDNNASSESAGNLDQAESSSGKVTDESAPCEASGSVHHREIAVVEPLLQPQESSQSPKHNEATEEASATHPAHRDERIDAMLEAFDSMSEDNFEQLFQNLSAMKSKAANLSPTERKAYAEKMTIAFWRSIGGNESEIDMLSSDDENQ